MVEQRTPGVSPFPTRHCECVLGLLDGKRLGWPLFRGKELDALPASHMVRTLGAHSCPKPCMCGVRM